MTRDDPQRHFKLVAAIASQRSQCIPGQALRVQPGRNVVPPDRIAVHDGDVFTPVAIVPEAHNLESPEPAGQIDDRRNPDADFLFAKPFALMVGFSREDVVDRVGCQSTRFSYLEAITLSSSEQRAASARPDR